MIKRSTNILPVLKCTTIPKSDLQTQFKHKHDFDNMANLSAGQNI